MMTCISSPQKEAIEKVQSSDQLGGLYLTYVIAQINDGKDFAQSSTYNS